MLFQNDLDKTDWVSWKQEKRRLSDSFNEEHTKSSGSLGDWREENCHTDSVKNIQNRLVLLKTGEKKTLHSFNEEHGKPTGSLRDRKEEKCHTGSVKNIQNRLSLLETGEKKTLHSFNKEHTKPSESLGDWREENRHTDSVKNTQNRLGLLECGEEKIFHSPNEEQTKPTGSLGNRREEDWWRTRKTDLVSWRLTRWRLPRSFNEERRYLNPSRVRSNSTKSNVKNERKLRLGEVWARDKDHARANFNFHW